MSHTEERTIGMILERVSSLDEKMDNFVTKDQFWPVKTLVYGFVGIALIGIVTTMVYSVLKTDSQAKAATIQTP